MSFRRDQKKKMQPIISILNTCFQQNSRQIIAQQQINQGICEQLLQSDAISKIQSPSTLRLIIYELILLLSQQNLANKKSFKEKSPIPFNRICNLLNSFKDIAQDFYGNNEDYALRSIQKKNGKQSISLERSQRNKQRIFSSYYNQLCDLLVQIQRNQEENRSQMYQSQINSDDALIDQLEAIIFKKQSKIEVLQNQMETYRQKLADLQEDLNLIKLQYQDLMEEKQNSEDQRDSLRNQLLEIMKPQPQITLSQQENSVVKLKSNRCFWDQSSTNPLQITRQKQFSENQLMKCLISQALTIEALIQ